MDSAVLESNREESAPLETTDDNSLTYDLHDTSKYIEIDNESFEKSDLYNIISGKNPCIKLKDGTVKEVKFKLSKHLRNLINKTFGTASNSDYIEISDLAAIKKAFSGSNNKVESAIDETIQKMNNFIEYAKNHNPGLLASYEACLINESFYSYGSLWFKKIVRKYAKSIAELLLEQKKNELINQLGAIFEFISEKLGSVYELPGVELLDLTNPAARAAHQRKVTFLSDNEKSPRSFSSEAAKYLPKTLRDVNCSVIGRVCPVETPESEKIGLIEFLARGASIDIKTGDILSSTRSGKVSYDTEETAFFKHINENYHSMLFDCAKPFNSLEFEKKFMDWKNSAKCPYSIDPVDALGYSALLIPFINHNDAARSLM
ncbi:MAG TPA: hypothetical protein PKW98_17100, partial [Candidatus Wallbacteria bacterium]|nr:hypothetical protein [Candidatus Wallbacteria bacterium]